MDSNLIPYGVQADEDAITVYPHSVFGHSSYIINIEELDSSPPVSAPQPAQTFSFTEDNKTRVKELEDKRVELYKDQKDLRDQVNDIRATGIQILALILTMMTIGVGVMNFMHASGMKSVAYLVGLMSLLIVGYLVVIFSQVDKLGDVRNLSLELAQRRTLMIRTGSRLVEELRKVTNDTNAKDAADAINIMIESLKNQKGEITWHFYVPSIVFFVYLYGMVFWAVTIISDSQGGQNAPPLSPSPSPLP
ncbi:hypothetical protein ACP275_02G088000 [Erythranthe tilingii]